MKTKDGNILRKAYKIALKDLRVNYGKLGIYAGPEKLREYWARDSFITSFGACSAGDLHQAKKNLDLFSKYQRKDGHIPARLENRHHTLAVMNIKLKHKKLRVLHKQTQPWASVVVDSNSWYLISATNYVSRSEDKSWLKVNTRSLQKAADWLVGNMNKNGLIYEGITANWSDCNLRSGYMIYNNVLAWSALKNIGRMLTGAGNKYEKIARKLKKSIVDNFWDEDLGYFIDRIDKKGRKYKYFYTDGNLLSIWLGMVDSKKGKKIVGFIDKNNLNNVPVPTCYPKLDFWNDLFNRIVFAPYRSKNTFTWWGCVLSLARVKLGDTKEALADLTKVADKIVEYGTCHEVLTPEGKPVHFWFYKSEKQVAWTAGMFVHAYHQLRRSN